MCVWIQLGLDVWIQLGLDVCVDPIRVRCVIIRIEGLSLLQSIPPMMCVWIQFGLDVWIQLVAG